MVKLFGWKLFNGMLPTKNQLARRNIIHNDHDLACCYCSDHAEDLEHLMLNYQVTRRIWGIVQTWHDTIFMIGDDCCKNFLLCILGFQEKVKKIWLG